ncbi:MAG: hypothetical protein SFZ02_03945, partial [bacterium]|nr:hypothetical protein [bacterium]
YLTQTLYSVPMQEQVRTESAIAPMMPMPTMTVTLQSGGAMPPTGDGVTEEAMMDTMTSMAFAETTASPEIVEVMGNAIPSTPLATSTPTATIPPSATPEPPPAPKAEEDIALSVDIVPLIGIGLIVIGMVSLLLVILRGRKG